MSKYNLGFRYVIQEIKNYDLGTIIECENGNKYELGIAENGQRKFSRKDGTKLRFMTYDNIDKMFRVIEDEEIDIQAIEEVNTVGFITTAGGEDNIKEYVKKTNKILVDNFYKVNDVIKMQNKLVQAVKQLDKRTRKEKE